ncbi:MAG TPA: signal peptidase I [Verrucomicrobiales bacterium]|nr:signal peptidase I [Verrucomicrobiales bacterium]
MRTENTIAMVAGTGWRQRLHLRKETRQGHILLCVALWSAISFLVFSRFVLATVIIDGVSMEPTFQSGDHCLLNRLATVMGGVDRGDMVVLCDRGEGDYAIKRVIGVPNDDVEIRDGLVFLNGERLDEAYLADGTRTYAPAGQLRFSLGPDSYFVLGDNRALSEDSRYYGPVSRSKLLGVVLR